MKVQLKQIRQSRGLSQNKLAQLVDMTLQNIQKIEYGKTKGLQYDALNKLCKALNCQPGDLLIYEPDDETQEQITNQEVLKKLEQVKKLDDANPEIGHHRPHSFLTVIAEVPESA
ncbi:helix-turn-helix domain-containing protein [Aliterella atlantica]|uniref:helix-turn-helix domain-containing protein n=1 Tax=Aliterella atlantica TaxID=1827278 RepID=UPI0026BF9300